MTARDRGVLIGVVSLAVLAAVWLMLVSPERQKASKLNASIATASSQLATAESELASAHQAQQRYAAAYSSVVNLGKAVPPTQEVPSLVYELALASNQKDVEFASIAAGQTGSAPGSGSGAGSGSSSSSASASAASVFTQMPFTFVFNGNFFDLEHMFHQLDRFTQVSNSGSLQISGRLLTVQSVKLAPVTTSGPAGKSGSGFLSGTVAATAYVLPASQGLTAGATAAAPAGAGSSGGSGSSSAPTTPAIARVTP
jgi:Tfp pilus assembly protein PilO